MANPRARAEAGVLAAALLAFLALAPAADAAGGVQATLAVGTGSLSVQAPRSLVVARPGATPVQLALHADRMTVTEVDDVNKYVITHPNAPDSDALVSMGEDDSKSTRHEHRDATLHLGAQDPDTVLLLEGADLLSTLSLKGTFRLQATEAEKAEGWHFVAKGNQTSNLLPASSILSGSSNAPVPYEFRAESGLRMNLSGLSQASWSGSLRLYLWGVRADIGDARGTTPLRTGYYITDDSTGTGELATRHYAYAILDLEGASVQLGGASGETALYAPEVLAQTEGRVTYVGAVGEIPADRGRFRADGGNLTTTGGQQRWAAGAAGTLDVAFLAPVPAVTGSVTFAPPPPVLAITAAAVALALAATFLLPTACGVRARWRLHADVAGGALGLRAAGYAQMAVAAERRSWFRLAAWLAGRACRCQPGDPERALAHAIYLRQAGRPDRALARHQAADAGFRHLREAAGVTHNALEAARAATQGGRLEEAVGWAQVAIEADPGAADPLWRDPDFFALRRFPDFLSLASR